MKFDGNYRYEDWEYVIPHSGEVQTTTLVIDDEQVTTTYEAFASLMEQAGFKRVPR